MMNFGAQFNYKIMGSWNGTCFLSHLPIEGGDKIKIIFLRKNNYVNPFTNNTGVCDPDTFFKPLYFPISGEYDDYGGIKCVESGLISEVGLTLFKNEIGAQNSKTLFTGRNKSEISEIFHVEWSWENVWISLERGIGKFHLDEEDEDIEFGQDFIGVMIRQDVWDAVVKVQLEAEYGWGSEILQNFLTNSWKNIVEDSKNRWIKFDSYDKFFYFYSSKVLFRHFYDTLFSKDKLRDDKLELILEGKENFDLDIFQQQTFEMYAINAHLIDTRRIWGWGGSGSGGQSTNWKTYQKLYQVYSDISKEKDREYEEDGED